MYDSAQFVRWRQFLKNNIFLNDFQASGVRGFNITQNESSK